MTASDTLTTLFKHHLWANEQLFTFCASLTPAQLDTKIAGAFGTIYETLAHIALSERSFFRASARDNATLSTPPSRHCPSRNCLTCCSKRGKACSCEREKSCLRMW